MSEINQNTPNNNKDKNRPLIETTETESNTKDSAIQTKKTKGYIKKTLQIWRKSATVDKTQIVLILCNIATIIAFIWVGSCQHVDNLRSNAIADTSNSLTKQSLKIARENSEIGLSAYVGVDKIVAPEPAAGKIPYYTFDIKNFGNTPANNVALRAGIKIGSGLYTTDFEWLETLKIGNFESLPPAIGLPQTNIYYRAIRVTEMDSIQRGILKYCIFGFITYRDIFEREKKTIFAFSYSPQRKNVRAIENFNIMR